MVSNVNRVIYESLCDATLRFYTCLFNSMLMGYMSYDWMIVINARRLYTMRRWSRVNTPMGLFHVHE